MQSSIRSISAWSALAALCVVSILSATAGMQRPSTDRVQKYFGAAVMQTVKEADRVEVYRLAKRFNHARRLDDQVTAGPITPSKDWARRLRNILEDPHSYGWDYQKQCAPRPGVAVRFLRGTEKADVLLCFECRMLSIASPGKARYEDFDSVQPQLVRLVKEVFPKDPVIQALQERRPQK